MVGAPGDRSGQQRQLPRTAQHDIRRTDDGPRGRRQAVPTVGADADDGYPQVRGRHGRDASVSRDPAPPATVIRRMKRAEPHHAPS